MSADQSTAEELDRAIRSVPDPEIPVVTIDDLGILREVRVQPGGGVVHVTITPTYSGCPAMQAITDIIASEAARRGWRAEVSTRLSPPWTTDWITEHGRRCLQRFGIAPPVPAGTPRAESVVSVGLSRRQVACPRCGSTSTEEVSHFSGTACKALRRCCQCREPFEEFKTL